MLKPKVLEALNDQLQKEFESAYLYLAMSNYCVVQNYPGAAQWLRIQYEEETAHALKILDYIQERGNQAGLAYIKAPAKEFGSLCEVFEQVLQHEESITARIHQVYEVLLAEKDYATQIFWQWFITEQVKEEATTAPIVEQLRAVGEKASPGTLFYIDKQLGKRAAK